MTDAEIEAEETKDEFENTTRRDCLAWLMLAFVIVALVILPAATLALIPVREERNENKRPDGIDRTDAKAPKGLL